MDFQTVNQVIKWRERNDTTTTTKNSITNAFPFSFRLCLKLCTGQRCPVFILVSALWFRDERLIMSIITIIQYYKWFIHKLNQELGTMEEWMKIEYVMRMERGTPNQTDRTLYDIYIYLVCIASSLPWKHYFEHKFSFSALFIVLKLK